MVVGSGGRCRRHAWARAARRRGAAWRRAATMRSMRARTCSLCRRGSVRAESTAALDAATTRRLRSRHRVSACARVTHLGDLFGAERQPTAQSRRRLRSRRQRVGHVQCRARRRHRHRAGAAEQGGQPCRVRPRDRCARRCGRRRRRPPASCRPARAAPRRPDRPPRPDRCRWPRSVCAPGPARRHRAHRSRSRRRSPGARRALPARCRCARPARDRCPGCRSPAPAHRAAPTRARGPGEQAQQLRVERNQLAEPRHRRGAPPAALLSARNVIGPMITGRAVNALRCASLSSASNFRRIQRERGVRGDLRDQVVVVRVEPLRHLQRRHVPGAARGREIAVEIVCDAGRRGAAMRPAGQRCRASGRRRRRC